MLKRNRKFFIAILLVICIPVLVELICNLKLLTLPKEQSGLLNASEYCTKTDGFLLENGEYSLVKEKGSLTFEFPEIYIDEFQYQFFSEAFVNATVEITKTDAYGNPEVKTYSDTNPILLRQSVFPIHTKVIKLVLQFEKSEELVQNQTIIISDPAIKNISSINWIRVAIAFLFSVMIASLILFRDLFFGKIEYGFALIALVTGLSMLLCFPATKVGWDEETHFRNAYNVSLLGSSQMMTTENAEHLNVSVYNWPLNLPETLEEEEALANVENDLYENGDHAQEIVGHISGYGCVGVTHQAVAIFVARLFGGSFSTIYFLGRLAGLLAYIFVLFFAIRLIPIGKKILAFISLMPTGMFLSLCFTYDTLAYALVCLGIAIVLREWLSEKQVNEKMILLAYACFFVGTFSKLVYAPFMLMVWFIPNQKFKNKKHAILLKLLSFTGILAFLVVSFLPQVLGMHGNGDTRGGAVDAAGQIHYILTQPFSYAGILLKQIYETFFNFVFGLDSYRLMGHLPNAGFAHIIPAMAIALIFVDTEGTEKLKLKGRIEILVLIAIVVALIWTALYVSFTPCGATYIAGVQGRYYRPFLPLFYIILTNRLVKVNLSQKLLNVITLGVSALIMGVTVIQVFLFMAV